MREHKIYHVYVLELSDGSFYIGFSADLKKRCNDHKLGKVKSTKHKLPLKLTYYELYLNKLDALNREKILKGGSGRKYLTKQLSHYLEQS